MNKKQKFTHRLNRSELLAELQNLQGNVVLDESFQIDWTEITYAYRHGVKRVRLDSDWQSVKGSYQLTMNDMILLSTFDDYDYAKKEWANVERDWENGRSINAPAELHLARAIRKRFPHPDQQCWIQETRNDGIIIDTSDIYFYLDLDLAEPLEFTDWDDMKTIELREIHRKIINTQ